MPDETTGNIENGETFSAEQIKEELIEYLRSIRSAKRPNEVSRLSNYPYYRKHYALEIKQSLDRMIEGHFDIEWKFSDYPELSKSSLYQRIYQAMRCLCEQLDPDRVYTTLREKTELVRTPSGVRMSWIKVNLSKTQIVAADEVVERDKSFEWKTQVEEFLVDHTRQKLHITKLSLTPEQAKDLEVSFQGLEGIYALVTIKEIKIIKDSSLIVNDKGDEQKGQGFDK